MSAYMSHGSAAAAAHKHSPSRPGPSHVGRSLSHGLGPVGQQPHSASTTNPVYYGAHGYAPIEALSAPYAVTTAPTVSPSFASTSGPPAPALLSSSRAAVVPVPPPMASLPSPRASHPSASSSSPSSSAAAADPSAPSTSTSTASSKRRLPRAAATYPRKRATQACLTCRFRRTKCDNARPACASCVRLGADCSYREADPSTLTILHRLDELERLLRTQQQQEAPTMAGSPARLDAARLDTSSPASQAQSDLSCAVDVWSREKRPRVSIDAVLRWAPFADVGLPTRMFPAPRKDADGGGCGGGRPVAIDLDLPAADTVLRNFFDNVHAFNPILDEEVVQDHVKLVRFQGIGWDAVSCLMLLIYALGTVCTRFARDYGGAVAPPPSAFRQSADFDEAEAYFAAAQKRMGLLLCGSGVMDAQCFFLAGVYLMTTLRPVDAWKMFVQALACCQGFLGPIEAAEAAAAAAAAATSPETGRTEDDSNPKRRIYWACYKSELELRLELNPSQKDVWDLTYPTFFPSPPDALKARDETAWYFYLAEIALTRLKNRILSHLYQSDAQATHAASIECIADFEEQVRAWLHSLPPPLELHTAQPATAQPATTQPATTQPATTQRATADSDAHSAHRDASDPNAAFRMVLNGHLLDCQEILYWPFVVEAVHGRPPPRSGSADARFAAFLRKGLRVCVDRIRQSRQAFRHRHHGTWLMLRSSTRSALVLLAVARCPLLVASQPAGWDESVAAVADMLRLWQDESSDVREMRAAVEMLQTSCKV